MSQEFQGMLNFGETIINAKIWKLKNCDRSNVFLHVDCYPCFFNILKMTLKLFFFFFNITKTETWSQNIAESWYQVNCYNEICCKAQGDKRNVSDPFAMIEIYMERSKHI